MKYRHYLYAALGISSAAILASCQDADFGFNPEQYEYRTNFEKMYGSIQDIPTWDFSSYNLRQMGLEGGPSAAATRAGVRPANYTGTVTGATEGSGIIKESKTEGIGITNYGDYYSVQQATLNWLNANLTEGVQTPLNVTKGNPFVLGVPESDFAIIPIYQGHAGMCWDLHLVADDGSGLKDYKIWSKSQGIKHELDFSKSKDAGALTNGEEFCYDAKNFTSEGGYASYWTEGDNSGIERIHFRNMANTRHAFPGIGERNTSDGDYVQVWFQLPAGATITGYFETSEGYEKWGYNEGSYTTLGNSSSTSEQWIRYDLIDGSGNKWNNGNFNELTWHNQGTNNCQFSSWENDRVRIYTRYNYQMTKTLDYPSDNWDTSNLTGNTVNRTGVGAKPILIDKEKIKSDFFIYLKITAEDPDNSAYASVGDCQRSDEGMMVALPLTKPTNIDGSKEYMIIGCEDSANPEVSDWDVNDIVFLLVGQGKLPRVKETISKRYMIEDLGSTYDFDFNDIVVDVTQTQSKDYKGDVQETVQTANLVHLCGTIPFQLKIGNTQLGKVNGNNGGSSVGGAGFDPSTDPATYGSYLNAAVTGWNPNNNNIEVTVWPTEAGATQYTGQTNGLLAHPDGKSFSFPAAGEFPYIIACDQSVNWMPESYTVPTNWFNTWPASFYEWNHGTDSNQSADPPTPTIVDLSSDKIGEGWNIDKTSYPSISFTQNWAGFQWWYDNENFSEYAKVIVTYTRKNGSESLPLQLVVEYNTEDGVDGEGKTKYKQSTSGLATSGGSLEVTLSNDYKSGVRQIFIQNGEGTGSIIVSRAYAEK